MRIYEVEVRQRRLTGAPDTMTVSVIAADEARAAVLAKDALNDYFGRDVSPEVVATVPLEAVAPGGRERVIAVG